MFREKSWFIEKAEAVRRLTLPSENLTERDRRILIENALYDAYAEGVNDTLKQIALGFEPKPLRTLPTP